MNFAVTCSESTNINQPTIQQPKIVGVATGWRPRGNGLATKQATLNRRTSSKNRGTVDLDYALQS
jgi:hypothetical protein